MRSLETLQENMSDKDSKGFFSNLEEFLEEFKRKIINIYDIIFKIFYIFAISETANCSGQRFKVFYQFSVNSIVSAIRVMDHSA